MADRLHDEHPELLDNRTIERMVLAARPVTGSVATARGSGHSDEVGNPAFEANVPDVFDSQVFVLRNANTLALAVGLFFGWVIVQALADDGIGQLRIPIGQLVVVVVLAALAGVLAAVNPSRRAANFDILRAIAAE